MPETTFGTLLSRALALMDHPLDGQDQLLAAHGGKVLQRIVAVATSRVLASPRFPELVSQASYKVLCAEAAAAAAQADGVEMGELPAHVRDGVTTTVYVALEALSILYTATDTPAGCAKVLMYHHDPVCLVGSLTKGLQLWHWPEATRAAGAVLERLFAHTATAQWLLTLPPLHFSSSLSRTQRIWGQRSSRVAWH